MTSMKTGTVKVRSWATLWAEHALKCCSAVKTTWPSLFSKYFDLWSCVKIIPVSAIVPARSINKPTASQAKQTSFSPPMTKALLYRYRVLCIINEHAQAHSKLNKLFRATKPLILFYHKENMFSVKIYIFYGVINNKLGLSTYQYKRGVVQTLIK